jgi:hypothetical protein
MHQYSFAKLLPPKLNPLPGLNFLSLREKIDPSAFLEHFYLNQYEKGIIRKSR